MNNVFVKRFLKSVKNEDHRMIKHDLHYAMFYAIENGDIENIKYYVNNFMDNKEMLFFENEDQETYLKIALKYANKEIINYFISLGLHLKDSLENLLEYAIKSKDISIVKNIVEHKLKDVGNKNLGELGSVLTEAIDSNSLPIVEYIVELGANINYLDGEPLNDAVTNGNNQIIKYLIEKGADMRLDKYYAPSMAYMKKNTEILEYFIEKGLSTEELISFKDSPLSGLYDWVNKYNEMKIMSENLELELPIKHTHLNAKL